MEARHGLIVGMFGPPSKLADETDSERHEDNLDREPDSDEGSDLLAHIHADLRNKHPGAAHFALGIAHFLQQMVAAAADEDWERLDHFYEGASQAIAALGDEDDGE